MKKTLLLLSALLMLGFSACKKETVDVTHLLASVPSSASGVVVLNMEGLLEDAGCKVKDHQITPSPEIMKALEKTTSTEKESFKMLFSGDSGIEPKGAVIFYDSNRTFLTFALYDEAKFEKFVEKHTGQPFVEETGGVKMNGTVALKDAQAWVSISGKRIDPDGIAAYSKLKDSQSFLVTTMGEKLLVDESDVRGWAMINVFVSDILNRNERSMFSLALGFLFEDAESVSFKMDFDKGEIESELVVLNDKYKPAKYQLPSDKIDVSVLKELGSTCDGMMAFTLNSKLIKKFDQLGQAFGGALFGDLNEMFKNVDGTVGIVASTKVGEESYKGIITTKGDIKPALRDFISGMFGTVSQEGKYLTFSKGEVVGKLNVAECADDLKGSCLGMVVDASGLNSVMSGGNVPSGFSKLVLKFKPESGGLEVDLEVKTADPKENALMTILRSAI